MKAATKPNQIRQPYRLLKTGKASKLSGPNAGRITYQLLADQNDIYITVTHNEGTGLWSKEVISLSSLERLIDGDGKKQPFRAKAIADAYLGRSSNNCTFALAVLKDLEIVQPAQNQANQYCVSENWAVFKAQWMVQEGEHVMYPSTVHNSATEGKSTPPMSDATPPGRLEGRLALNSSKRRLQKESKGKEEGEHVPLVQS